MLAIRGIVQLLNKGKAPVLVALDAMRPGFSSLSESSAGRRHPLT